MATIVTAKQVAAQAAQVAAAAVATLLTVAASFARYHTRGTQAMCSYRVAGAQGIVFLPCAMFAGAVCPPMLRFTGHALGVAAPKGHTALVYRGAVAGGKAGRHSYGVPGMRGTFTICATLLGTPAPAVLHINVVLAAPALPQVGTATSAVVAAGNVAIATATAAGKAVATPRKVAAVAAKVAAAKVAAAQRQAAIAHAVSMAS